MEPIKLDLQQKDARFRDESFLTKFYRDNKAILLSAGLAIPAVIAAMYFGPSSALTPQEVTSNLKPKKEIVRTVSGIEKPADNYNIFATNLFAADTQEIPKSEFLVSPNLENKVEQYHKFGQEKPVLLAANQAIDDTSYVSNVGLTEHFITSADGKSRWRTSKEWVDTKDESKRMPEEYDIQNLHPNIENNSLEFEVDNPLFKKYVDDGFDVRGVLMTDYNDNGTFERDLGEVVYGTPSGNKVSIDASKYFEKGAWHKSKVGIGHYKNDGTVDWLASVDIDGSYIPTVEVGEVEKPDVIVKHVPVQEQKAPVGIEVVEEEIVPTRDIGFRLNIRDNIKFDTELIGILNEKPVKPKEYVKLNQGPLYVLEQQLSQNNIAESVVGSERGLDKRLLEDFDDAGRNAKDLFGDIFFGSDMHHLDQYGKIKTAKKTKGIIGSLGGIITNIFIEAPKSFAKGDIGGGLKDLLWDSTVGTAADVLYSAGNVVDDIGGLAINGIIEPVLDSTFGNIHPDIASYPSDGIQVTLDYVTDVLPGNEAWRRVHDVTDYKGNLGLPVLTNLKAPIRSSDSTSIYVTNTDFRKTIETLGGLGADVGTYLLIKDIRTDDGGNSSVSSGPSAEIGDIIFGCSDFPCP